MINFLYKSVYGVFKGMIKVEKNTVLTAYHFINNSDKYNKNADLLLTGYLLFSVTTRIITH